MGRHKRRAGGLLPGLLALLLLQGCVGQEVVVERSGFSLNTVVSIQIMDHGSEEMLDTIFERIRDIEDKMSATRESSDISRINGNPGSSGVPVSEDTYRVVERGLAFAEMTGGKFNIALGPVTGLWKIGTEDARVPSPEEIREALEHVDYRKVRMDPKERTIYLEDKGMRLDLGGIAKGYAADAVAEILREGKVKGAIVNLGGNVFAHGEKADGSPWKIGVQGPFKERNDYVGIVEVRNETIVTSGPYERSFEQDGVLYHHIMDNETGYPVDNGLASVTIVGKNSMDADGLSTAVYAMGLEAGMAFVEGMEGLECILITNDREVHLSNGIRERFSLKDQEYKIIQ
ncbi:FAD:protein FMN transferase [Anaerotalea alkaliphila]|uniref:FAD:protein FMN transferase n=1 Tax=Anaerotalea alkaliphila TaxID=2662126 RepID=A0A7X5HTV6_9FIRM|nr:FAD:protein FMN transferase [Anaerotalea alkaliphila]NDL66563.1 FAD:protein FMN transferase [Anaerotalea alkaliphila]